MNKTLLNTLENLFGSSGMEFAFESIGHKTLTKSNSGYQLFSLNKPNAKKNKTTNCSMHFNYSIHLIHTIEDIDLLNDKEYGLPIFSNFPLANVVIQPDTIINFTISNKHKGAIDKLDLIRLQLHEKDYNKHKFVIVTKYEILNIFKYIDDLNNIKQYVTTYDPISESSKIKKRNNQVINNKQYNKSKKEKK